jgi:SET domain-containing protein
VDDGYYFDMVDQTRWINHSCEPNVEIETDLDGKGGAWARVVAVRPIREGEELTYDYGFPHELAEPCVCGTAKCAGWIVDADELPELVARLEREKPASAPSESPAESRRVQSDPGLNAGRLRF